MTARELDALLDGQQGVVLEMANGEHIWLDRHELETPQAWRSAMRRQLGHTGYEPPIYSQASHDEIVRVLFRMIDAQARERRRAA